MVKLLCIVEIHGTNSVERAREKLDVVRMQMADNDINEATIYQVTQADLNKMGGWGLPKSTKIHILP